MIKNKAVLMLLLLSFGCEKPDVALEQKEGIIIDIGNEKTYAWSDLTYGNMGWVQRENGTVSGDSRYYYFFDGEDVVIQAKQKPTKVLYFETAKSKGEVLIPNGKNVVRVKLGEYGSFNFHYPFRD